MFKVLGNVYRQVTEMESITSELAITAEISCDGLYLMAGKNFSLDVVEIDYTIYDNVFNPVAISKLSKEERDKLPDKGVLGYVKSEIEHFEIDEAMDFDGYRFNFRENNPNRIRTDDYFIDACVGFLVRELKIPCDVAMRAVDVKSVARHGKQFADKLDINTRCSVVKPDDPNVVEVKVNGKELINKAVTRLVSSKLGLKR